MEFIANYIKTLSESSYWYYSFAAVCIILLIIYLFKKSAKKAHFRKLVKILNKQILYFTKDEIERRIRFYIWPDCQSVDPQNRNQEGKIAEVRSSITNTMDQLIFKDRTVKHIFLMAASGMGKTTFLLNYFAYLNKKVLKKYQVELIPMSLKNVFNRLKEIDDPANTILLLDGYDDIIDTKHTDLFRLHNLMDYTKEFYKVVITCHVQSIPQDNIIPKIYPKKNKRITSAVEKEYWSFLKLYLSAFNSEQIIQYINKRFNIAQRKQAIQLVNDLPNLAIRPFYLEYIDDLLNAFMSLHNSYQVYNEIFEAWLNKKWNKIISRDEQSLHDFMLLLALKLYLNRENWKDDYIPYKEIKIIAQKYNINLEKWNLKSSFFLNRDEVGNHTFAHRSIMDFLFSKNILLMKAEAIQLPFYEWDEQVIQFVCEGLRQKLWCIPYLFVKINNAILRLNHTKKIVKLKSFEISRRAVTNQEFEEFDPSHRNKRNRYSDDDEQPVVYVSWADANRYCDWLSKKTGQIYRLPTEAEWEYVAGEGGKRTFPWGNEKVTPEYANYDETKISRTTAVCSFPKGETPDGIYDLAGNVWEWCADHNKRKEKIRIIKGGSFGLPEDSITVNSRLEFNPNLRVANIGFRLVREA